MRVAITAVLLIAGEFLLHDGLLGGAVPDGKEASIGGASLILALIVVVKAIRRLAAASPARRWAVRLLLLLVLAGGALEISWAGWVHSQREWQVIASSTGQWEAVMIAADRQVLAVPKYSLRNARFYETGIRVRRVTGEELTIPRKHIFGYAYPKPR